MVKNLPCNVGEESLIPGWGTKILHALGQPSPRTATTKSECTSGESVHPKERSCMLQLKPDSQICTYIYIHGDGSCFHVVPTMSLAGNVQSALSHELG